MAGHLGLTVAETKQRVGSREFTDWIAFNAIEPIGPQRYDVPIAILCDVVARCNGAKNTKPRDFLPLFDGRQSQQQMRNQLTALFGPPKPLE